MKILIAKFLVIFKIILKLNEFFQISLRDFNHLVIFYELFANNFIGLQKGRENMKMKIFGYFRKYLKIETIFSQLVFVVLIRRQFSIILLSNYLCTRKNRKVIKVLKWCYINLEYSGWKRTFLEIKTIMSLKRNLSVIVAMLKHYKFD